MEILIIIGVIVAIAVFLQQRGKRVAEELGIDSDNTSASQAMRIMKAHEEAKAVKSVKSAISSTSSISEQYRLQLKEQSKRLPPDPTPAQVRTVRLIAMSQVTLDLMDANSLSAQVISAPEDRQKMKQVLMAEYLPFCAIPSVGEIPDVFELYLLFKFGDSQSEVDIAKLKRGLKSGVDNLPGDSRAGVIEDKHLFEWGKLI